ncbi:ecotin [Angomonas deanei]|uniref:Carboxylesterase family/alpha/beta hydrolase fold, putative n=1 Tax=Angomonas deanei TaxID=59799 RepID=A0A7G2CPX1_9TRYP|nr:ecotin [Angomonas deanei]CAD2221906.1 Carboxylesterase family/alpha/beta hydrolase fold, putative [Angomonas deanei]|eukprot:EPY29343.1 ecotin [Angomonas deanei]
MELLNTYTQLNLADGAETEGLPLPLEDVVSKSSFAAGMSMNNNSSFDEALAALQKLIRRREAKQQQAKVSPSRSGSFFFKSAPVSPQSSEKGSPDRQEDFIDDDGSISLSRSNFNDTEEYLTGDSDLSEEEDEEDKNNLHNRATLDIYLPMPLDSMFRLLDSSRKYNRQHDKKKKQDEEESGGRHSLFRRGKKKDNHYSSKGILQPKKFPILICVNGGAWIVGCYFWNFLIARIFAARGYVVFCPDYRNFPQTTMEGMVLDVSDAIAWVLQNAERYNGDLNNVTLMGQSAGAHLTMMSLLSQAHLKATEENNKAGGGKPIAPPSSVAYNVPRYNPRQSIHRYVGLSGIYNLKGLVGHFDKRGLYRDVLYQICGGKKHLSRYTVVSYFDPRKTDSTGEAMPDNLFDFFPQQVLLVHGDADKSAPLSESANLAYLMNSAQRDALIRRQNNNNNNHNENVVPPVKVDFVLVPGASHTCAIIEEPLSCRNSHIVELLQNYNVRQVEEAKCYNTPYVVAENGCVPPHVIQSQGKSYQVSAASPSSRGKKAIPHRRKKRK